MVETCLQHVLYHFCNSIFSLRFKTFGNSEVNAFSNQELHKMCLMLWFQRVMS